MDIRLHAPPGTLDPNAKPTSMSVNHIHARMVDDVRMPLDSTCAHANQVTKARTAKWKLTSVTHTLANTVALAQIR